ncbi:hypothetical protein E2C01_079725 [Portunus trituberculatus]|uniref:Uncharacterized protein n=1 Tax=Portunus trituberculatus TaxID=210409 RepID=A0A5B7IKA5_PORTR|nr:hypothetical protein [Portunus trituberculatus]
MTRYHIRSSNYLVCFLDGRLSFGPPVSYYAFRYDLEGKIRDREKKRERMRVREKRKGKDAKIEMLRLNL